MTRIHSGQAELIPGYPSSEEASMTRIHSGQAELIPGYPSSVFQPIRSPLVPNPCHDPIFGNPDANHRPGQGGGFPGISWDAWEEDR